MKRGQHLPIYLPIRHFFPTFLPSRHVFRYVGTYAHTLPAPAVSVSPFLPLPSALGSRVATKRNNCAGQRIDRKRKYSVQQCSVPRAAALAYAEKDIGVHRRNWHKGAVTENVLLQQQLRRLHHHACATTVSLFFLFPSSPISFFLSFVAAPCSSRVSRPLVVVRVRFFLSSDSGFRRFFFGIFSFSETVEFA